MNPRCISSVAALFVERKQCQTIDKMTTQGRFKEDTISTAKDVLPEPEEPATPMMLVFAHGGR